MMVLNLYKSLFCRLCGERNKNGVSLYDSKLELHAIVNRYLPIKVIDDGIYPTTICPGCRIHLEDTSLFIDTIVKGQAKLKELLKEEDREKQIAECHHPEAFTANINIYDSPRKALSIIDSELSSENFFYSKDLQLIEEPKNLLFETESLLSNQESSTWVDDFLVHTEKCSEISNKLSSDSIQEGKALILDNTGDAYTCSVSDVLTKGEPMVNPLSNKALLQGTDASFPENLLSGDLPESATAEGANTGQKDCSPCVPSDIEGASLICESIPLEEAESNELVLSQAHEIIQTPETSTEIVKKKRGRRRKTLDLEIVPEVSEPEPIQSIPNDSNSSVSVPIKRKRGRPRKEEAVFRKPPPCPIVERISRVRKPPTRFSGVMEGKELDKALKDVGAIHEEESPEIWDSSNPVGQPNQSVEMSERIGQMLTLDAKLLGYVTQVVKFNLIKTFITCDGCDKNFKMINQFLLHKSEALCGLFECFRCKRTLSSCEERESHEGTCQANSLLKWLCGSCNETFNTLADLQHHTTLAHDLHKCMFCQKKFLLKRNLEVHMCKVHPKKKKSSFRCQHCGKEYFNLSSVLYHEEKEHHSYLYQCFKCDKYFSHRQLLSKHQIVHVDSQLLGMSLEEFPCHLCDRVLKSASTLRYHLRVHDSGKDYTCAICLSLFKYKKSLMVHMKSHSGEKPYQCSICSKEFNQKGNLVEHLRIHSGERPHQCNQCQSAFKTSSQLKCHRLVHSGQKPFSCTLCLKRFHTRDALEIHSRRHKGEKPFTCAICTKSFVELPGLKKHLRIHSGERPYTCRICARSFADCSNLSKHIKNVHKQATAPSVAAATETLYLDLNQISTEQLTGLRLEDLDASVNDQGDSLCLAISNTQSQLQEIKELNGLEDNTRKIVTDELGVPLKVTLADGSQLQVTTVDGESLQVVTNDGVSIPVKLNVEGLDLTTLESLNVDNSLTELTNIGDDYGIRFVTDEGQDIRILPCQEPLVFQL